MVAAISDPRSNAKDQLRARGGEVTSNIMFNLQHDVGKWCTEYTWSAEDGMWGVRVLHNFGRLGTSTDPSDENISTNSGRAGVKRVDEEDAVEGGLKGRVSMGAELYFSAKEKSAGGESIISIVFERFPNLFFHHSICGYPFYDASGCHPSLFSCTFVSFAIDGFKRSATATSNDHHCLVQPYGRSHVGRIHCPGLSRPFSLVAVRL